MDMRVAIPEQDVTPAVMEAGLEATTRLDQQQILRGDVPLFNDAGPGKNFVWQPEPPGAERFDHAKRVLSRGWGDCDDIAPYLAASYRATGDDPKAKAIVVKSGPNRWHAIVQRGDGSLEDPSVTAGMPHRVVVGGDGIEVPPEDIAACPAVVPRIHKPGYCAVALRQNPVSGLWYARADVPIGMSKYALSSLRGSRMPSQAIVGAVNTVLGWSSAAGVLKGNHLRKLTALAGLCSGSNEYDVAQVCGKEAVRTAWDMAKHVTGLCGAHVLGQGDDDDDDDDDAGDFDGGDWEDGAYDDGTPMAPLMPPSVSVHAPLMPPQQAPGQPLVGPVSPGLATAAKKVAQHPKATPDEAKLASIVHDQALGIRPPLGSMGHAIRTWFDSVQGPVVPGSADDHARLLIADQAAKTIANKLQDAGVPVSPLQSPTSTSVGFDFGSFLSDVGNAVGQAGKAVATVVQQVGPTVAQVASVIPPPYGTAISAAATGAVALANAVNPQPKKGNGSSSSKAPGASQPGAAAVSPGQSYTTSRPVTITPGQGNLSVQF